MIHLKALCAFWVTSKPMLGKTELVVDCCAGDVCAIACAGSAIANAAQARQQMSNGFMLCSL